MRITSSGNATIKGIRALRGRKERERTGLYFAEGLRVVREAVGVPWAVETLVVAPDLVAVGVAWETVAAHRAGGGRVLEVSGEVFASLSGRDGPQGIAAVARQRWSELPRGAEEDERWVALYGVQHPGNLGAVLRTSDAAGARGVILIGATTDPYDPVSVRASMGTIVHQQLVRCTVEEFLAWASATDRAVIGTSGAAARDYREVRYGRRPVLVMGAERRGLPPELLGACQEVVRIPMAGRADSLNLAVAAGLVLYEAVRAPVLSGS